MSSIPAFFFPTDPFRAEIWATISPDVQQQIVRMHGECKVEAVFRMKLLSLARPYILQHFRHAWDSKSADSDSSLHNLKADLVERIVTKIVDEQLAQKRQPFTRPPAVLHKLRLVCRLFQAFVLAANTSQTLVVTRRPPADDPFDDADPQPAPAVDKFTDERVLKPRLGAIEAAALAKGFLELRLVVLAPRCADMTHPTEAEDAAAELLLLHASTLRSLDIRVKHRQADHSVAIPPPVAAALPRLGALTSLEIGVEYEREMDLETVDPEDIMDDLDPDSVTALTEAVAALPRLRRLVCRVPLADFRTEWSPCDLNLEIPLFCALLAAPALDTLALSRAFPASALQRLLRNGRLRDVELEFCCLPGFYDHLEARFAAVNVQPAQLADVTGYQMERLAVTGLADSMGTYGLTALLPRMPRLHTLELGYDQFGTFGEMVQERADVHGTLDAPMLTRIVLENPTSHVMSKLPKCHRLRSLELRSVLLSPLRQNFAASLARALPACKRLTTVELKQWRAMASFPGGDETLANDGEFKAVVLALAQCPKLTTLSVSEAALGVRGVGLVCGSFVGHPCLRRVVLKKVGLVTRDAAALCMLGSNLPGVQIECDDVHTV